MVMNQGAFRDMLSSVRGEERAKALDVDLPPQFGRAPGVAPARARISSGQAAA